MGKYENDKKKRIGASIFMAVAMLGIIVAALAVILSRPAKPEIYWQAPTYQIQTEAQDTQTEPAPENQATDAPEAETRNEAQMPDRFPMTLAEGKLEIQSLFQFDGINPDCGNQEGTDIASVMLKNVSGEYLAEAKLTLTLTDGTKLNFKVNDLPAGKTVMAFSAENASMAGGAVCADAACEAVWEEGGSPMPEQIGVSVDGMSVTLTNNSGADISKLVIYCRCPLGEEYFGGAAYSYTVHDLAANETVTVDAVDCILGMAEVVRIGISEE